MRACALLKRQSKSDRAREPTDLDSFGSGQWAVALRSAPLEGDAELIFSPPRHPASPVCMPVSETQFETIRHVARVNELDARPTIGEVDNGARDRRPVCEDFGVFQKPGAPDGSALVHGLACRCKRVCRGQTRVRSFQL
jgi:hypothetical protein